MPPERRYWVCVAAVLAVLPAPSPAAHPIEEKVYDRTITVRLTPRAVVVDYHLEVNARTAYSDVPDLVSKTELAEITSTEQVYRTFLDGMAPLLGKTLYATLDDRELTFVCKEKRYRLLDHLRCEYRFEAAWEPAAALGVGAKHQFAFREANFEEEKGAISLSLAAGVGVQLLASVQPDEALLQRKPLDLLPRDRERLRTVSAAFKWTSADSKEEKSPAETNRDDPVPQPPQSGKRSLEELILHSGLGFGALLFVVALWGTVHALTPGHGKTAAAAYLVGQHGTLGHALLLGVVTTLTHTGVVMVLALIFPWLFPKASLQSAHGVLMVVGGLLIAAVGFWLLLRRLAGQADHFHFGGGHHHHHSHGDHHGHDHSHPHSHPDRPVTLGSLIVLGIGGGLVPCSDALAIFGICVKWQRPELAFPLVVAFSAGLASVLVLIGLSVVYAQRFPLARWGENPRLVRFLHVLPTLSALIVIALGLWMCYDGVHTGRG
jgi:ABC-type nickel/cobalt efflux system permease component RcnA